MPILQYERKDVELRIRSGSPDPDRAHGKGRSGSSDPDASDSVVFEWYDAQSSSWARVALSEIIASDPNASDPATLDPVREGIAGVWAAEMSGVGTDTTFPRLVIRTDASMAGFPWETWLADTLSDPFVIVRAAGSTLRASELPLTFPLRIAQTDRRQFSVAEIAESVFAHSLGDYWPRAVTVRELTLDDLPDFQKEAGWPTLEVLHMSFPGMALSFPDIALDRNGAGLLSTGSPDLVASVGGLERITSRWQTRLLVMETEGAASMALARRIGRALTDRGGPAALVIEATDPYAASFMEGFYAAVFHDRPLDWAVGSSIADQSERPPMTLFGGGGREECLRLGNVARDLASIVEKIDESGNEAYMVRLQVEKDLRYGESTGMPGFEPRRTKGFGRPRTKGFGPPEGGEFVEELRHELNVGITERLDDFHFEEHESGGVVPVVEVLERVRVHPPFSLPSRPQGQAEAERPRFINARLRESRDGGDPVDVPNKTVEMWVGQPYLLAIDVGPKPDGLGAARATAVVNEVLLLDPDVEGRWVDVAVSGIDFRVEGSSVQQLWVPQKGPSQAALFAVTPTVSGYAVLRYCVYADQNLVQSFKLAALVSGITADSEPYSSEKMAALLDLDVAEVAQRTWLSRLEYGTDVASIQTAKSRKVSIVSNELRGEWVISVKSPEAFSVRVREDLADDVARVRDALDLASLHEPELPADREDWPYDFEVTNEGDDHKLQEKLIALATVGYDLFTKLIPNAERPDLLADLEEDDQVIKVAHLLLEKVIPWSVIYDHEFSPNQNGGGAVCTAALPSPDGDLPQIACGEHPQCLLHPDNAGAMAAVADSATSVVCPRHFWGFRHQIELPVHQIGRGGVAKPPQTRITAADKPRVSLGVNGDLPRAGDHLKDLKKLEQRADRGIDIVSEAFEKNRVVKNLRDPALDLVYFYCHAEGGKESPSGTPILKVRELPSPPDPQGPETFVEPSDLSSGPMYDHHPLVILNGCRTAAFRPDTLSRFITTFVEDRWASGVLGTEISVFEQLASEVGCSFLELLLAGEPVGAALARVRRRLLAKRNPLGLVYTLYADSELTLGDRSSRPTTLPSPGTPRSHPRAGHS